MHQSAIIIEVHDNPALKDTQIVGNYLEMSSQHLLKIPFSEDDDLVYISFNCCPRYLIRVMKQFS